MEDYQVGRGQIRAIPYIGGNRFYLVFQPATAERFEEA